MANQDLARVVLGLREVTQLRRDMKKPKASSRTQPWNAAVDGAGCPPDGRAMAQATKQIGERGKAAFGLGKNALAAVASTLTAAPQLLARARLWTTSAPPRSGGRDWFDVEFLQAIEHGASLAGVEINTLNSALTTFTKNASLAVGGKDAWSRRSRNSTKGCSKISGTPPPGAAPRW